MILYNSNCIFISLSNIFMPLSAQATPQANASSIVRLLHLAQKTLQPLIYSRMDKENINSNQNQSIYPSKSEEEPSDFHELASIFEEFREYFMLFKLKGTGNNQNLMESQAMLDEFANRIENWSKNCQSRLSIKGNGLFESLQSISLEIVSNLHALTRGQSSEVKHPAPAVTARSQEKRSLLTQKLKEAELDQLQAQLILRHVRSQKKEPGTVSPLNDFNKRERTAPIRMQNPHSLFQQPLNFSLEPSTPSRSRSRVKAGSLLSQMSFQRPAEQRRARRDVLGCGRCQIY